MQILPADRFKLTRQTFLKGSVRVTNLKSSSRDSHDILADFTGFERYVICHLNGMHTLSHRFLSVARLSSFLPFICVFLFPNGVFLLKTNDILYKLSVMIKQHYIHSNLLYRTRVIGATSPQRRPLYKQ